MAHGGGPSRLTTRVPARATRALFTELDPVMDGQSAQRTWNEETTPIVALARDCESSNAQVSLTSFRGKTCRALRSAWPAPPRRAPTPVSQGSATMPPTGTREQRGEPSSDRGAASRSDSTTPLASQSTADAPARGHHVSGVDLLNFPVGEPCAGDEDAHDALFDCGRGTLGGT